jgi:hypothetical protein
VSSLSGGRLCIVGHRRDRRRESFLKSLIAEFYSVDRGRLMRKSVGKTRRIHAIVSRVGDWGALVPLVL